MVLLPCKRITAVVSAVMCLVINWVNVFHTCVYVGVFLHIRLLVEALAAVWAGIRPGVTVDQKVGGQGRRPLEALATLLALGS